MQITITTIIIIIIMYSFLGANSLIAKNNNKGEYPKVKIKQKKFGRNFHRKGVFYFTEFDITDHKHSL